MEIILTSVTSNRYCKCEIFEHYDYSALQKVYNLHNDIVCNYDIDNSSLLRVLKFLLKVLVMLFMRKKSLVSLH